MSRPTRARRYVKRSARRPRKGTLGALLECAGLLSHEDAMALLEAVREMRREDREAE